MGTITTLLKAAPLWMIRSIFPVTIFVLGIGIGVVSMALLSGDCYSLGALGRWGENEKCRSTFSSIEDKIKVIEKSVSLNREKIVNIDENIRGVEGHLFKFNISDRHRNRFATGMEINDYPVGMIIGWHLICEPTSHDRDIESIFLEPKDGIWNLYLEHKSKCLEIEVMVGFITKYLSRSYSASRTRSSPDGGDWPESEAKERFTREN